MGQTHPRADLSCCVESQDGGMVGTVCRVDVSPVAASGASAAACRAALIDGLRSTLQESNRRLGLVCPRPALQRYGRVVVLVITATDADIDAALAALPFLRRGPRGGSAGRRSAEAHATDVLSTDAYAIPGFGDGWPEQGAPVLRLAGPVHAALLRRRADTTDPESAPAFAVVLGENHTHADGCPVPGGAGSPPCASGMQLVNAVIRAAVAGHAGAGAVDLFVESGHTTAAPTRGSPSLITVVERALLLPCNGGRAHPGCPSRSRVRLRPVDGRFTEPAWISAMELADRRPDAFLDMWRDVGGEAGLVAAISGMGPPHVVRRCRDRLNAMLAAHGEPLVALPGGSQASRLQLAVDTLREQGREGLLEAAFAAAGPLPATVWRRHLMAFVVELEALALWLDRRTSTTSRGIVFISGAFHSRRMVTLLAAMGMEVAFEKESTGLPVPLDAEDLAALRALCHVSPRRLLAPSCLLCRPPRQGATRTPPDAPPLSGVVVAGCQAACWVVRRADNCAVGLVVLPGPAGSVAAMLDPYFAHVGPCDAAALAVSSSLFGNPRAAVVAADMTTERERPRLAWSAADVLARWAASGRIARVYPVPAGTAAELGAVDLLAMFVASFASTPNTFPLAVGDFRDPANPRRFAQQVERISKGELTAPWGYRPPERPLAPTGGGRGDGSAPVASGALLPVPAGADVALLGVPAGLTYPARVGSSTRVPWGVRYQTPDVVMED